jgi:ubiquinone/menaquinone biosynthesis C-methylase UbiE
MSRLYQNPEMALGYARCRPVLHSWIVDRIGEELGPRQPLSFALDIGCGSGLSTAPLTRWAEHSFGLEPSIGMLPWGRQVAPRAIFVGGHAEKIPFRNASFDWITAAGSLNYTHLSQALEEIARVLRPNGSLFLYDFSTGRSFRDSDRLDQWFDTFLNRFPPAKDSWKEITAQLLQREAGRLQLQSFQPFETELTYHVDSYIDYLMTETNVAQAIENGQTEYEIRTWCRRTLAEVFGQENEALLFRGYVAHLAPFIRKVRPAKSHLLSKVKHNKPEGVE